MIFIKKNLKKPIDSILDDNDLIPIVGVTKVSPCLCVFKILY